MFQAVGELQITLIDCQKINWPEIFKELPIKIGK